MAEGLLALETPKAPVSPRFAADAQETPFPRVLCIGPGSFREEGRKTAKDSA